MPDLLTHPVLGRGFGTLDSERVDTYRIFDNEYLGQVFQVGALGLLAFLALIIAPLLVARSVLRSDDPVRGPPALAAGAACFAFGVASALYDILTFPQAPYLFLFMAAICTSRHRPSPGGGAVAGSRAAAPGGAGVSAAAAVATHDFSVVVVTHNGRELALRTLRSALAAGEGLRAQWIVVDSGSADGTPEAIERELPEVELLRVRTAASPPPTTWGSPSPTVAMCCCSTPMSRFSRAPSPSCSRRSTRDPRLASPASCSAAAPVSCSSRCAASPRRCATSASRSLPPAGRSRAPPESSRRGRSATRVSALPTGWLGPSCASAPRRSRRSVRWTNASFCTPRRSIGACGRGRRAGTSATCLR